MSLYGRIRCVVCHRIRVRPQPGWTLCRPCWRKRLPMYRVVRLPNGATRRISTAKVARMLGRAKGAETIHAAGTAHHWTPASARAAAVKRWRQTPVNQRIGVRLKLSVRRAPRTNHPLLRRLHTDVGLLGIWYKGDGPSNPHGRWLVRTPDGSRDISERAAFVRLGYLKTSKRWPKWTVDPIGTTYARSPRKNRTTS